ncbi:MAG TPA: nickel-dependent lactate racemase [Thermomicrobiales bacterium]|nr:nickel-dependent lactate racemase [Thermomicrobiales bacterium]
MSTTRRIPFGSSEITVSIPDRFTVFDLKPDQPTAHPDPAALARERVTQPIGSSRLAELARGATSVVIAVTDATRACPDHILLPPMLAELESAGLRADQVTIVVAVGTHRPSTEAEKRAKLGDAICDRYMVIDHDPYDPDQLVTVYEHDSRVPFRINRRAVEADILIATGIVEPHQYAGYSGGGKTIAIGCANEAVIEYTHGPALLDHPGTRLARIEGNPFQRAVREVARRAGLDFVANVVKNTDGGVVDIRYGAPEAVHDSLAALASTFMTAPLPHQVDVAIAGVPAPKDANLYQSSRAASYLQFAPVPVVRPGGTIIVPSACPEGIGEGTGEQRFGVAMRHPGGANAILEEARRNGIRAGAQRAYVMAQVLQSVDVVVARAIDPGAISGLGFGTSPTVEAALDHVLDASPGKEHLSLLVAPYALQVLPIVPDPALTPSGDRR